MPFSIDRIAQELEGTVIGDANLVIERVGEVEDCQEERVLALALTPKSLKALSKYKPQAVVLSEDLPELNTTKIITPLGKEALIKVLNLFFPEDHTGFISDKANIDPSATLGINVKIYPGVYVGEAVTIGDNTVLFPNVVIYDHCVIGNNVRIHANTTIGADGFGYVFQKGEHVKVPQVGNVIIEDNVEIGANTTIDRATMKATIIGAGTKIDNKVHIAHNCIVGKNCLLVGSSNLAGSAVLGNNVIIAGGAGVADGITIGDGAIVYAFTVAARDVAAGEQLYGTPIGDDYRTAQRRKVIYNKLPEIDKKIKELEKKLQPGTKSAN